MKLVKHNQKSHQIVFHALFSLYSVEHTHTHKMYVSCFREIYKSMEGKLRRE